MTAYYSMGEAARLLDVQRYRISYAHSTGRIPEPPRLFGRRAYRWPDLQSLADHFGVSLREPEEHHKERRNDGRN